MVGCRTYGRMGNFLFQAAATIHYALKHGLEFSLPNYTHDRWFHPLYLQHLVHPNWVQKREDVLLNENGMQYQEIPFKEEWRDKQIVLNGYWQSWKYTDPYRKEILELFNFPYEKMDGVVSVHVRRTDYLLLRDKHPEVKKEWYESAMKLFDGRKFKIFSDDLSWCKNNFGDRSDVEFSTNTNEVDDLVEISCCEHNINSSSTFSWWGSWMNQNPRKTIITPQKWFNDAWDGLDTSDVVPPYFAKL